MVSIAPDIQKAFADTVLPGSGRWPKASDVLSFPNSFLADFDLPESAMKLEIWTRLLDADEENKFEICKELETIHPEIFQALLPRVFAAYYSNPKILDLIEVEHSYPARPPMPIGQVFLTTQVPLVLPPAKTPLWRKDGTDVAEKVYTLQEENPNKTWSLEEIKSWHM
jgi:hypothetical protein